MIVKEKLHIAIVGAGFGGLYATKELAKSNIPIQITLIDARNFHLFQPLLYQVATGQLSPEDIAYPTRAIFSDNKKVTVIKAKVQSVDLDKKEVKFNDASISYDKLILSTGVKPYFFGNKEWEKYSPGLKSVEDALEMRRRILDTFEKAETKLKQTGDKTPLNFIVIGGGPTGIELTGALAELGKIALKNDFRKIHPDRAKIYLIEAGENILQGFPSKLIGAAERSLKKLGVIIKTNSQVVKIEKDFVEISTSEGKYSIQSTAVLWAAGIKTTLSSDFFEGNVKIKYDNAGRIIVNEILNIDGYPDVFIIGDLANFSHRSGKPLPGTAPVAMQQGRYAAKKIKAGLKNKSIHPFRYRNKGTLAVIGRNAAIADFGPIQFTGSIAWVLWVFIHIGYLIGFKNRILVMTQWAWNYFGQQLTARIIYGRNDKTNMN
jgi:NADH dehydrogenase